MQTSTESRFVQRLEKFDAELDSTIYLIDELCKYTPSGDRDIKSIIEASGLSLLTLRKNLKRFLNSNLEQSKLKVESATNFGR
jgi:hypothetical protein